MAFKLAATIHSEIDATLLVGKLKAEGFEAKTIAVKSQPTYYSMTPDTFGIYVDEKDFSEAKKLCQEFTAIMPGKKITKPIRIYAIISTILVLGFLAYLLYQTINNVFYQNGFSFPR